MPTIAVSEDGIVESAARTYFDNNVRTANEVDAPKLAIPNPDPDAQATVTGVSFHSAGQVQIGYSENAKLEAGTTNNGYIRLDGVSTFHNGVWQIAPGGIDESANTLIILNPAATDNSEDVSAPSGATVTNIIYGWKTDAAISTTAPFVVTYNLYAENTANTAYPALQEHWTDPDSDSATEGSFYDIGYQDFREQDPAIDQNGRSIVARDGRIEVTQSDGTTIDQYYPDRSQVSLLDVSNEAGTYNASTNPYLIDNNSPHINVQTASNGDIRVNIPDPASREDGLYRYTIRADSRNGTEGVIIGMVGNRSSDAGYPGFQLAAGQIGHVEVTVSDNGAEIGWRLVETISRSKSTASTPLDSTFTDFTSANINPVEVNASESDNAQDQDSGQTVITVGDAPSGANENAFQMNALGEYRLRYHAEIRFNGTQPSGLSTAFAELTPRLNGALVEGDRVRVPVFLVRESGQDGYIATVIMEFDHVNTTVNDRITVDLELTDIPSGFTFANFQYRRMGWRFGYTSGS